MHNKKQRRAKQNNHSRLNSLRCVHAQHTLNTPSHMHTHTERTQWLSGERCKLMYGKIESIRFASIDWQAILKMLPRMWQREMEIEMCILYTYIIYVLKCASWTMSHFKPIVCKNFMRQLQIVCVWHLLGGSVSKCVCVGVGVSSGVRSVYCSLYYLFWLPHAYFSSRQ